MTVAGRFIEDLTWPELADGFRAGVPVILPIGAAAKEHGHHLPMKTDWLLARALSEGTAARLPVLIAPIVRVVTELLEGLLDQGARRIAIVNTGVSTEGPIGVAARAILDKRGIKIGIADIRRLGRSADHLLEQKFGSHADERETSIMLAIAPALVHMDRARADYGKETPPGIFATPTTMQSVDADAADYSETGAFGDPTLAGVEKGRAFLDAMIADLVQGLIALFPDLATHTP